MEAFAKFAVVLALGLGVAQGARVAGKIAPDSRTEIQVDLPGPLHRHNISSRGEGCCTQTSVHHSATFQNVPALWEFHEWIKSKGIPGGSYPSEMKRRIELICKDRGVPVPEYIQVEGGRETLEILRAALATGRFPAVTYSRSPTGRYNGQRIAHMVNLAHLDTQYAAILDNNYPGDNAYEWMSVDQFLQTYTGGRSGWAVILLDSGPPPFPWN